MDQTILSFTDSKSGAKWQGTAQEALKLGISPEKIQAKIESTLKLQKTLETGDPTAYDTELKNKQETLASKEKGAQGKKEALAVTNELLGRDTGALTGIPNPLKYLTGENQYTKNLLEQFTAKLAIDAREKLKGTGQISDYEAELLQKSVSALRTNLSNADFKKELQKTKDILEGKYKDGSAPEAKQGNSGAKQIAPALGGLLGGAGGAIVGGPVGAGAGAAAGYAGVGAAQNALLSLLGIQDQKPGEQVKAVATGAVTEGVLTGLLGGAGKLGGKAATGIKGALATKAPKITESSLVKGLEEISSGGKARETLIKGAQEAGKKVNGSKIYKTIEAGLKKAKAGVSQSEQNQIDGLISQAKKFYKGKKLNPTTAKERWDMATQGFKDSGKTGDTVKSTYHRVIRDGIRKQLEKVAPGFEKATATIKKGIEEEKILKGVRTNLERSQIREGMKETPSKVAKFGKDIGKRVMDTGATVTLLKLLGL